MIGETLFVKTTGEPVFVVGEKDSFWLVRRPVMAQETGIRYELAYFQKDELESRECKLKREVADMENERAFMESKMLPQAASKPMELDKSKVN